MSDRRIGMEWGVGLGERELRGVLDVTCVGDVFQQIHEVWLTVSPPGVVQQHQAGLRQAAPSLDEMKAGMRPKVQLYADGDQLMAALERLRLLVDQGALCGEVVQDPHSLIRVEVASYQSTQEGGPLLLLLPSDRLLELLAAAESEAA